MNLSRRGLLGMFAAGASAAIVRTPGLLMPIKPALQRLTADEIIAKAYHRIANPAVAMHAKDLESAMMFGEHPKPGDTLLLNGHVYNIVYRTPISRSAFAEYCKSTDPKCAA